VPGILENLEINQFLLCKTPHEWIACAQDNLDVLLIDHANCEKKAASTALNLMYRYVEYPELLLQLSKLAREELRHFEQVVAILTERKIPYEQISSARYAGELRKNVRTHEPGRLIDILIVSAIVEARSCERFEGLMQVLDDELAEFYGSLLKSEARHFKVYLDFAKTIQQTAQSNSDKKEEESFESRVSYFLQQDKRLIESQDTDFRFHSGRPKID
jgi:tRNA-(ms[2]io[6]A)-hydroxylase|tara:strand:- start:1345 stop:1995 length:651 start_codon:yes stop_codon:yes gene_type:complete